MKEDVRDSLGNQISPLRVIHEAPSRPHPPSLLKLGHAFNHNSKPILLQAHFLIGIVRTVCIRLLNSVSCVGLKVSAQEDFQARDS